MAILNGHDSMESIYNQQQKGYHRNDAIICLRDFKSIRTKIVSTLILSLLLGFSTIQNTNAFMISSPTSSFFTPKIFTLSRGFVQPQSPSPYQRLHSYLFHKHLGERQDTEDSHTDRFFSDNDNARRQFLQSLLPTVFIVSSPSSKSWAQDTIDTNPPLVQRQRAVGSAEQSCRQAGNCLETFELDGAIGWNWGGKDRCDPTDPKCGVNGQLRSNPLTVPDVPLAINDRGVDLRITNTVEIQIVLGKREYGTFRIGLYGDACPASVEQFVRFCSSDGLITASPEIMQENGYTVDTTSVRFSQGGMVTTIEPERRIHFGIPSQAKSYARANRLSRAGDNFIPQPRPYSSNKNVNIVSQEDSARSHTVAGLVSIPKYGLGYGGNYILDTDDEAYADSFCLLAVGDKSCDKEGRKVIGQLMDDQSMSTLARISSLPTIKGLKGFLPGLNAGPPLVPVTVISVVIK